MPLAILSFGGPTRFPFLLSQGNQAGVLERDRVPELPDIELYLTSLRPRLQGHVLEAIRLADPFLSRLLRKDWPRSLDELEDHLQTRKRPSGEGWSNLEGCSIGRARSRSSLRCNFGYARFDFTRTGRGYR